MTTTGEEASWNALRALQERMLFLQHMAIAAQTEMTNARHPSTAATRFDGQVTVLRSMLEEGHDLVE